MRDSHKLPAYCRCGRQWDPLVLAVHALRVILELILAPWVCAEYEQREETADEEPNDSQRLVREP